jgi:hypothetical protein
MFVSLLGGRIGNSGALIFFLNFRGDENRSTPTSRGARAGVLELSTKFIPF